MNPILRNLQDEPTTYVSMMENLMVMNAAHFVKMAHGNVEWMRELAQEFFDDTRRALPTWTTMMEQGDFAGMRTELHRCRGGASLFGVDRLVAMIRASERPQALESEGFDTEAFQRELDAAAQAVADFNGPCE